MLLKLITERQNLVFMLPAAVIVIVSFVMGI